jgi:hypothetical protein
MKQIFSHVSGYDFVLHIANSKQNQLIIIIIIIIYLYNTNVHLLLLLVTSRLLSNANTLFAESMTATLRLVAKQNSLHD